MKGSSGPGSACICGGVTCCAKYLPWTLSCIVMVGFFTSATKLISADAMRNAVKDSVPRGTEALNLSAFDKGYEYGLQLLKA
jgi:Pyruvate/2-oxoacid:ferredoxin oxidoreductase gamma subunit